MLTKHLLSPLLLLALLVTTQISIAAIPSAPQLDARSLILIDFNSGKVLAEKNADKKLAPASLTKIMTAFVVFREINQGNLSLEETSRISEKAWRTPGSRMFIEVNKRVSIDQLLHGMLVQSGNDASVALAEHIAGDESTFAQMMNLHAEKLGMKNSHFVNSTGLPHKDHYTTAKDLSILTRALIKESPELYKLNAIKEYTFNGITQKNRNKLLWRDATVDGVKTGHTEEAGYCLVASSVRDDMRLISVVMGTESMAARNDDNQALLNYGYRFYKTYLLYKAGEILANTRIWKGSQNTLPVGLKNDLYITIPRNQYKNLDAQLNFDDHIMAPLKTGQTVGNARISLNNDVIVKTPLFALKNIEEGSFFEVMKDKALLLLE